MLRSGASQLLSDSWDVEALSTCQGVPSYAFDDSEMAREIFAGIDVAINPDFHSPQELLAELSTADLVITTRMHLAILSIISQKPVIAIAYEFKTLELFQALGLGNFVVKIEDASEAWLNERIALLQASPELAVLTDEKLQEVRESALSPSFHLKAELSQLGMTDSAGR
jgi:colanic acid/amylovoran biosynthesis protein